MHETLPQAVASDASPARVLVVDDNSLNRMKMRRAVEALGHHVETAENGTQALEMLMAQPFDAVLLDIVMPEVDGFGVLATLKSDPVLSDIPVIVISSLDGETESVVRAIELGAEDFLPKQFDPVLLNARLGASLTRKRYRDKEREYLQRIERLISAAEIVEGGMIDPSGLGLEDIALRDDPLGQLARVFSGMAAEIYQRELKLRRAILALQGGLLALVVGAVWGMTPALSRMASGLGSNPLGLALWVNAIAAALCLGIAAYRGGLPRLSRTEFLFFLGWALLSGILQRLATFVASAHVEAAIVSMIVTLQGFIAFAFATASGLERASPRRLAGLAVGLVGVSIVLLNRLDPGHPSAFGWLLFAMVLPLISAVEALVLADKRPVRIDIFASVGIMMALSALMLLPIAFWRGDLMPLGPQAGRLEILVIVMGVVATVSMVLAFHLIATAGPVFYSQSAYAMTIAGIIWGMLLLDEQLTKAAWLAFALIIVGMYLVEPKYRDEDLVIRRSFARR